MMDLLVLIYSLHMPGLIHADANIINKGMLEALCNNEKSSSLHRLVLDVGVLLDAVVEHGQSTDQADNEQDPSRQEDVHEPVAKAVYIRMPSKRRQMERGLRY